MKRITYGDCHGGTGRDPEFLNAQCLSDALEFQAIEAIAIS